MSDSMKNFFDYDKKHIKILLRILFVAALCLCVGTATHYYSSARPKNIYDRAQRAITKGDYYKAEQLLEKIEDYADAGTILRQIADENIVFQCIQNNRGQEDLERLLQVYQVEMYEEQEGYAVVLTFGLSGDDGDTLVRQALFLSENDYQLYHSPISFADGTSLKKEEDRDTYEKIEKYRENKKNVADVSNDRINNILQQGIQVQTYEAPGRSS